MRIETVGDLIAALKEYDPDAPVRWAAQPGYPLEYAIESVTNDAEWDDTSPTVWLSEGRQIGYLPGNARNALGW
ncbi:hypothetical protein ACWEV3_40205 [Saccharopolyspora sp. NPDC003752]